MPFISSATEISNMKLYCFNVVFVRLLLLIPTTDTLLETIGYISLIHTFMLFWVLLLMFCVLDHIYTLYVLSSSNSYLILKKLSENAPKKHSRWLEIWFFESPWGGLRCIHARCWTGLNASVPQRHLNNLYSSQV